LGLWWASLAWYGFRKIWTKTTENLIQSVSVYEMKWEVSKYWSKLDFIVQDWKVNIWWKNNWLFDFIVQDWKVEVWLWHSVLSRWGTVNYAWTINIVDGRITSWSNHSWHYIPNPNDINWINLTKELFQSKYWIELPNFHAIEF